jgi:hypothetical protein
VRQPKRPGAATRRWRTLFSWPNSSDAISEEGVADLGSQTPDPLDASACEWRGNQFFAVPVSPEIRTVESVGATFDTCDGTVLSAAEAPTISSVSVSATA